MYSRSLSPCGFGVLHELFGIRNGESTLFYLRLMVDAVAPTVGRSLIYSPYRIVHTLRIDMYAYQLRPESMPCRPGFACARHQRATRPLHARGVDYMCVLERSAAHSHTQPLRPPPASGSRLLQFSMLMVARRTRRSRGTWPRSRPRSGASSRWR